MVVLKEYTWRSGRRKMLVHSRRGRRVEGDPTDVPQTLVRLFFTWSQIDDAAATHGFLVHLVVTGPMSM